MNAKKRLTLWLRKVLFGSFFVFITIFGSIFAGNVGTQIVHALPEDEVVVEDITNDQVEPVDLVNQSIADKVTKSGDGEGCKASLGPIAWIVCTSVEKISDAVDWLYEKLENILVIDPITMEDGTPIFEIWKYLKGLTNIIFIVFLLIVIYSQITGIGINNYGIKKILPKLIIVAVMVNLSFLVCQLAVDVSNIVGEGLRGVFTSISETAVEAKGLSEIPKTSLNSVFAWLGGGAIAIGAVTIVAEAGAIWMLIPTVLGALVAVVSGLITISLRQAVVVLLVMISPLAMVAYLLPNTEKWFTKWKDLFLKMLVFYPAFSLLFGASQLAGLAIILSSRDAFGLLLGMAVQIFPLFFSWSLMRMSGTFLGEINQRLSSLAAAPLAANRAWADSHRQLALERSLGRNKTPSMRFINFLSSRRVQRENEIDELSKHRQLKSLARDAQSNYTNQGTLNRRGQRAYNRQQLSMSYERLIKMHEHNMNEGFSEHSDEYKETIADMKKDFRRSRGSFASGMVFGESYDERIGRLDIANMNASDELKMELERGAKIEYRNAEGHHQRMMNAMYAHEDLLAKGDLTHQAHKGVLEDESNIIRYEKARRIMEGNEHDINFAIAGAAHSFGAQSQIVRGKFKDFYTYTPATQDVVNHLNELTKSKDSNKYIDAIISGMQVLNTRGDTDLAGEQIENLLAGGKLELGTYASQSLANYLMFDMKGTHPFLRRFGKYINLETAKMYNEADPNERRTRRDVSLDEYVNGEYIDRDEDGNVKRDERGEPIVRKSKKDSGVLLQGTSFSEMERPTMEHMIRAIAKSSVDEDENGNKTFNFEKFEKNQDKIWKAIMPNIISDQFSYLSGSEQINSLGKGLTGVDVNKHRFDWASIFGDELASKLTPEQKKEYLKVVKKRTKDFLGGHVPVQIAKTKSDMLTAIRNQYALLDAAEKDPEFMNKLLDPNFSMTNEAYNQFEDDHIKGVKKEFVGSFKEDALKGFVKMFHKGYQGEAKDGLIKLLDPEGLYNQYFGAGENVKQNQQDDDEEDGMPVDTGMPDGGNAGPIYNDVRNQIEAVFRRYTGRMGTNVNDFWDEVKTIILSSPTMAFNSDAIIDGIEAGLSGYTSVDALYADLINALFGGFGA